MGITTAIIGRIDQLRMPYVTTLRDFDPDGIRFEISNRVERHRVRGHGGETDYMRAMLDTLRPDDVVYDVGVCVGLVALHAARICTVIGFEPDPSLRDRTERNLALNPTLHIDMHPCAISDVDGRLTLYSDGPAGMSPSLRRQRGEKGRFDVEARTLDSLVFDDRLPVPTALKMDIEGAEVLALRGASRLLASDARPRLLFLEVHDTFLPAFGASADDVMAIVGNAGYRPIFEAVRADQTHYILEG